MANRTFKNSEIELIALRIVEDLKNAGYKKTYYVGGYVRDIILGERSKKSIDIDIATEARPDVIKKIFKKERFIEIGEAFNIIMLVIKGHKFEIATFREDIFEQDREKWDGRYPKGVSFATAEDDAKRRDFTVNAVFFDPVEKKHIDFVNGIEDIKNKIIRTIGEPQERFREDYLRMLRAIRFAVQKNFKIESTVFKTIKMYSENIISISRERILQEMEKILTSKHPSDGLILLRDSGLLKWIYLYDHRTGTERGLQKDKFLFAVSSLSNSPENLLIRWAIFFQLLFLPDTGISELKEKLIENKFDNKTNADIIWILQNKKHLINWNTLPEYNRMELSVHPGFDELLLFLEVEVRSGIKKDPDCVSIEIIKEINSFYSSFKKDRIKWSEMKKFTIVNGNDLIETGFCGKMIGAVLKEIKKKYIMDELKNREEIMDYINDNKQDILKKAP